MSKNMFASFSKETPTPNKKSVPKKKMVPKKRAGKKSTTEKPEPETKQSKNKSSDENNFKNSPEILDLTIESHIANLKKQPLKNEAQEFINERKKLELLKEAGDVMEFQVGDFLFFGYMEKCNNDIISMTKKLKLKITNYVMEKDVDGLIKLIDREHKSILSTIKKNQKKDVKNWQKEHKA